MATAKLKPTTSAVYLIVCSRVGQLTFRSSTRASLINVVILFIYFSLSLNKERVGVRFFKAFLKSLRRAFLCAYNISSTIYVKFLYLCPYLEIKIPQRILGGVRNRNVLPHLFRHDLDGVIFSTFAKLVIQNLGFLEIEGIS